MEESAFDALVKSELRSFIDTNGRLTAFPAKRKKKLYMLWYIFRRMDIPSGSSEKQVNAAINEWTVFNDPATIRRELFDYGFIDRELDCTMYRVSDTPPTPEQMGLI